jgi:hypothetical protein
MIENMIENDDEDSADRHRDAYEFSHSRVGIASGQWKRDGI